MADLEGAEEEAYSTFFLGLSRGAGAVPPDDAQLRDFISTNTAMSAEEMDLELLKVASESESFAVELNGFLKLIREFPVTESDVLQQFMGLSSDGMAITSEDCRSGLLNLLQQRLHVTWPEQMTESLFDSVMEDASLTIGMEQWIRYCKRVGRVVRLVRYLRM